MKRFKLWAGLMWQPLLASVAAAVVIIGLLGFHLGSLTHGVSQPEVTYLQSVRSGKDVLSNPAFAPHKILSYGLFKLHAHQVALYRGVSALFAAAAVGSCFLILREWYSLRTALLGTWLFLTSAWILHIGRLATPEAHRTCAFSRRGLDCKELAARINRPAPARRRRLGDRDSITFRAASRDYACGGDLGADSFDTSTLAIR